MAFLTLAIVTFLDHFTTGLLKLTWILAGMVGGYIIGCFMGMVDLSPVAQASIFQMPSFMYFGVEFELSSCVALGLLFAINAIQTIGDFTATITGSMDREPTNKELRGAIAGIVPKFSALLTTIPQYVLGGATISIFASIAMTGIKHGCCWILRKRLAGRWVSAAERGGERRLLPGC